MNLIFADTFYFLALLNPNDRAHRSADQFPIHHYRGMVTTRWVLTELADALSAPSVRGSFVQVLEELRGDKAVSIVDQADSQFDRGTALYTRRRDKSWTLTDCISFVVMREKGIRDALTADRHFEQAGFKAVLK